MLADVMAPTRADLEEVDEAVGKGHVSMRRFRRRGSRGRWGLGTGKEVHVEFLSSAILVFIIRVQTWGVAGASDGESLGTCQAQSREK